MSPAPEIPRRADGPRVIAWLIQRGYVWINPNGSYSNSAGPKAGTLTRRLSVWRQGGAADLDSLDRALIALGCHLSELPDDIWLDSD